MQLIVADPSSLTDTLFQIQGDRPRSDRRDFNKEYLEHMAMGNRLTNFIKFLNTKHEHSNINIIETIHIQKEGNDKYASIGKEEKNFRE